VTFRARLTMVSAAAVAVAIVLASWTIYGMARAQLRGQVDEALRGRLPAVSYSVVAGTVSIRFPQLPLGGASGYAQIVRADGEVFRPRGASISLPVSEEVLAVAAGRSDPFFQDAYVAGTHVRVLAAPLGGGLAAQVARPLDEVDRSLHRLALFLLAVSVAGIGLAAGLGAVVARAAMAPVRRLSEATAHVTTTGDLASRIRPTGNKDELERLAGSFNTMLQALEASVSSQRRLVADASHELRTPLTSLRTNIEVLARAEGLPAADGERLLKDLLIQVEELSRLVGDLVELARGAEPALAREDLRLDELVAQAVERAERYAPEVRFHSDLRPSLVNGVPSQIERAVANLLDNAAKWTRPHGSVDVTVGDGRVTVRDHGSGVSEQDLPHVFDRFFRASSARGTPGSGLGLAIVKQIAESHGGDAWAENAEGGGARFTLRFPYLGVGGIE
jgi:two-component system, OmpR family, sensor histidine kinase MprB